MVRTPKVGFSELQRIISDAREKLRELVEEELERVDHGVITALRLRLSIDGAILKELRQLETEYSASAAPEEIAMVIRDAVSFFGRLFGLASAVSNGQAAVANHIEEALATSRRALTNRLQQEVSVGLKNCVSTIEADLRGAAEQKERELEIVVGSSEAELCELIASFEERKRRLDEHEARVRLILDVLQAAASDSEST